MINEVRVVVEEGESTDFEWKIEARPEETTRKLAKDKAPLPEGKPKARIKAVLG